MKKSFPNERLTVEKVEKYCQTSKMKDTDIEINRNTADLILKYPGMDECLRLYSGEKVILPLMMHQNYQKYLTSCKFNAKNKNKDILGLATEIAESISTGDIIENYIYSEQNWDMQDVHCYYTCINPSFKLSTVSVDHNAARDLKFNLDFPNDLNRTSIKKINKRNVINANVYLKNMDINDFMFANTLTKRLIEDKKIEECAKLYKSYDAKAETITSVLKIDKIDVDKNQYPTNIKKLFNKFL